MIFRLPALALASLFALCLVPAGAQAQMPVKTKASFSQELAAGETSQLQLQTRLKGRAISAISVNFGDGSPLVRSSNFCVFRGQDIRPGQTVSWNLSHRYAQPGVYTVTVTPTTARCSAFGPKHKRAGRPYQFKLKVGGTSSQPQADESLEFQRQGQPEDEWGEDPMWEDEPGS